MAKASREAAAREALGRGLMAAQSAQQAGRLAEAEAGYQRILKQYPDQPDALHFLGLIDHQRGRHAEAVKRIRRSLRLAPTQPSYWNNFGLVLRAAGELEEAEAAHRRALALQPNFPVAAFNLGLALEARGRLAEATEAYTQALTLQPGYARAVVNLAAILADQGFKLRAQKLLKQVAGQKLDLPVMDQARLYLESDLPAEAEALFRQASEAPELQLRARIGLARALDAQGRHEEAEAELKALIAAHPETWEPWLAQGQILRTRDPARAAAAYEQALAYAPDNVCAVAGLLGNRKTRPDQAAVLDAWRALPATLPEQSWERAQLELALGKACDELGRYDDAFDHFAAGNAIRNRFARYDPEAEARRFEAIREVFSAELLNRLGGLGSESEQPVFIVGMPRSGTTLTEQIIASHPEGAGAGELNDIGQLARSLPQRLGSAKRFPWVCAEANAAVLRAMAEDYLQALRRHGGSETAARITDKMPHNFANVGLIALMFPRARIVHCRRHLLDNAVSVYCQGLTTDHGYASDLAHIGHEQVQYLTLMAHWDRVLPGRVYHLDYERLTAEPETQVRALLEHLGLPWDERCLAFHQSRREVKTLSQWQVRQPLYTSSVARWRHYEKHLGPLKAALGPWLPEDAR